LITLYHKRIYAGSLRPNLRKRTAKTKPHSDPSAIQQHIEEGMTERA